MQIPDFHGLGTKTPGYRGIRPLHFGQGVTAQRQRQIHHLVGHRRIGDFQGLRHHIVLGQIEPGTIRKQSGRPHQANPAKAQVLGVQLQVTEAIQVVRDRQRPLVDLVFQISLLLLEVLGLDKQPVTPDDSIGSCHQVSSERLSCTSRSRRLTSRWYWPPMGSTLTTFFHWDRLG